MEELFERRLIGVLIIDCAEDAVPLADALLTGGLDTFEVTLRTPDAAECIAAIRKARPQVRLGAGTVLDPNLLSRALAAGAQFAIAPSLNEDVARAARRLGIPYFPGAATAREIELCLSFGCSIVKLFPAGLLGGVAMVKAMASTYAHTGLKLIPTGSINQTQLADYLAQPIVAAVGGSWMAERKLIQARDWNKITALTAEAMSIARSATKT